MPLKSRRVSPLALPRAMFVCLFALVLVGHAALSIGHALTLRPWSDEGAMAGPAYDLMTRGSMGTLLWDEAIFPGIHTHTYYMMPLYALVQAAWYEVTGVSLLAMRLLSLLCALLTLCSLYVLTRRLSFSREAALVAIALIAFDYVFMIGSSFGRMDMMSAMCGFGSLAAYLWLRDRNLVAALVSSASLSAAAIFTHPIAITHVFGLAFLVLYLDRERIDFVHILAAAGPFVFAAVLFGLYVYRAPADFVAQFRVNATYMGRLGGLTSPISSLSHEVTDRYLSAYGLKQHSVGHNGPIILKSISLFAYIIATVGCFAFPVIRHDRSYRILLVWIVMYFVLIGIIDGTRNSYYLVHITPLFAMALSLFAKQLIERGWVPAWLVAVGLVATVLIPVGGILYKMRINSYANRYAPVVHFLKDHVSPNGIVMASSAYAFDLGFDRRNLIDDPRLGYHSGIRPDFVVVDEIYADTFAGHVKDRPAIAAYVAHTLKSEYRPVYDQHEIVIYERTGAIDRR